MKRRLAGIVAAAAVALLAACSGPAGEPGPVTHELTVEVLGVGQVTAVANGDAVTLQPDAGAETPTFRATLLSGAAVVLTAAPGEGWHLSGWGGACSESLTESCEFTVQANTTVRATFAEDDEPGEFNVAAISPAAARTGEVVQITGTGFGAQAGTLSIGGAAATITSWTNELVTAEVAAAAHGGPQTLLFTPRNEDPYQADFFVGALYDGPGGGLPAFVEGLPAGAHLLLAAGEYDLNPDGWLELADVSIWGEDRDGTTITAHGVRLAWTTGPTGAPSVPPGASVHAADYGVLLTNLTLRTTELDFGPTSLPPVEPEEAPALTLRSMNLEAPAGSHLGNSEDEVVPAALVLDDVNVNVPGAGFAPWFQYGAKVNDSQVVDTYLVEIISMHGVDVSNSTLTGGTVTLGGNTDVSVTNSVVQAVRTVRLWASCEDASPCEPGSTTSVTVLNSDLSTSGTPEWPGRVNVDAVTAPVHIADSRLDSSWVILRAYALLMDNNDAFVAGTQVSTRGGDLELSDNSFAFGHATDAFLGVFQIEASDVGQGNTATLKGNTFAPADPTQSWPHLEHATLSQAADYCDVYENTFRLSVEETFRVHCVAAEDGDESMLSMSWNEVELQVWGEQAPGRSFELYGNTADTTFASNHVVAAGANFVVPQRANEYYVENNTFELSSPGLAVSREWPPYPEHARVTVRGNDLANTGAGQSGTAITLRFGITAPASGAPNVYVYLMENAVSDFGRQLHLLGHPLQEGETQSLQVFSEHNCYLGIPLSAGPLITLEDISATGGALQFEEDFWEGISTAAQLRELIELLGDSASIPMNSLTAFWSGGMASSCALVN